MAVIRPFRALRPASEVAKQVACVPYDVVYESEVRDFIGMNSMSFLRVTRAEAEFPEGSNPEPNEVFARARMNLEEFIQRELLVKDEEPSIYVYQLSVDDHSQTGVVACCSIDEYEAGHIKKHEKTRPDKVKDRTEHMLALNAQTGLIFLAFRNTSAIHSLIKETVKNRPIYSFHCKEGASHSVWQDSDTKKWVDAFHEVPSLYIADGHHRAESTANVRRVLKKQNPNHSGSEDYNFVVVGMFPAEYLRILAYNRVIKDLNGLSESEFLERISENFVIQETDEKEPHTHGLICLYLNGKWRKLKFAVEYIREPDPIERLDVSILQNYILGPILGIEDPRTDPRIGFVGGARGTAELERSVDEGDSVAAFSLFPTTMQDLLDVSDAGEIMPPKSTWFDPKLKDGLLVYEL
ncbi:MAG: DUF1015 domain-containing protein [Acidobacteria bacterium]|nr:MAG: DUF1015 domain-containing protein [Acidobacteriota bacterium]REJ98305.1 MAG: DUF1015 domain-containing protein [Acidobacteriota bacterium]REK17049.1 MAG: DUF1015 domain-containing protein [Acidobacteriota bacterium]REK42959.1 MAG: DUF1015 domain-containing protein [Acidobacteriota bacterium]